MKSSVLLKKARWLLEPTGAWTQKSFFRDAQGNQFFVLGKRNTPVAYCAVGALIAAKGNNADIVSVWKQECYLANVVKCRNVAAFNDHPNRRKQDVLKAFDRAIAAAVAAGD